MPFDGDKDEGGTEAGCAQDREEGPDKGESDGGNPSETRGSSDAEARCAYQGEVGDGNDAVAVSPSWQVGIEAIDSHAAVLEASARGGARLARTKRPASTGSRRARALNRAFCGDTTMPAKSAQSNCLGYFSTTKVD